MNEQQVRRQRLMRKTAFFAGFARYCHEHMDQIGVDDQHHLKKFASIYTSMANIPTLALIAPAVAAFLAGRVGGKLIGNVYSRGANVTPDNLKEREFQLAEAQARRLADEFKATHQNRVIREALKPDAGRSRLLEWNA